MTEEASNAEINQFDVIIAHQHNIARLNVAENNWRMLAMQIRQYIAQLLCPIRHTSLGERRIVTRQVFIKGQSLDILHYQEVPRPHGKIARDAG